MPEIRKDPVTGRAIIIAAERAKRPRHDGASQESPCPFCAGNEQMTPPEVFANRDSQSSPDTPGWTVRVVPNKYPALVKEGVWFSSRRGVYESTTGLGIHEVIIESPAHVANVAALEENQLAATLRVYRERMLELRKDERWRSILVYKNQGAPAGATLEHVHSQLIALPEAPEQLRAEIDGARKYYKANGRCLFCEMIRQDTEGGARLVTEHERWVALCPYAARFPFEIWILPKRHAPYFELSSDQDLADLAHCVRDTLARLNRVLDHPPLNYLIHSHPWDEAEPRPYHWHIEILPKLVQVAGFEWGSGMFINPVAPEEAARLLRQVTL
jgi:UDPglucose--hexose-1-phosphate uridylyltransferase